MQSPRPFAAVASLDQWGRCAHRDTALLESGVQLAWIEAKPRDDPAATSAEPAGLALDGCGRAFRTRPLEGRLVRVQLAEQSGAELEWFAPEVEPAYGDFEAREARRGGLDEPRGMAIDACGRLYVAEQGARRVTTVDLLDRRQHRKMSVPGAALDVAVLEDAVYVLLADPPRVVRIESGSPSSRDLPDAPLGPDSAVRIEAASETGVLLLDLRGEAESRVVALDGSWDELSVAHASDFALRRSEDGDLELTVARGPGQDFRLFRATRDRGWSEQPPLRARGYDGGAIAADPNGSIAFTTSNGVRFAAPARLRFERMGEVACFRLDSETFRLRWGRIFLDACVPDGCALHVRCATLDGESEEASLARTAPSNRKGQDPPADQPLPPVSLTPEPDSVWQSLHRRESGHEQPWNTTGEHGESVFEAPVDAAPGRYLFVRLRLTGNGRATPRVRSVRVEHEAHDHMRRLPRTYSRHESSESFLQRYLAIFDGLLSDLEGRARQRQTLLDPVSTPSELLAWLAGFLGLVLDERWPDSARRALIDAAPWLFRYRGTPRGLQRFLEIFLREVTGGKLEIALIERFRLRGLGGAVLGGGGALASSSVVGHGLRVGAQTDMEDATFVHGDAGEAFGRSAHRFSVVVPAILTAEQLDAVHHILDVHRPAHTLYDVCTVETGMRVGVGLHVELTSLVGQTAGFNRSQLGGTRIGRDALLGVRRPGTRATASRLDLDSRVGA